ncbi:MAG: hypothetical protein DMD35_12170 [Gemmatimonadetes bacterium]|nr:MAG: hypothetical protein DMD35_12170 [Gemmatimonadota bacterium]
MGRWHAHAIRHVGSRVVAVIDSDLARARALAARLPGNTASESSLQRSLDEHRIEVLHVCTPVESHDGIARVAIGVGIPLLIEKPLALDAATTRELHALAESRDVLLCPVHQFLFQPGILAAGRAMSRLGAIRQLDIVACSAGADGASDARREAIALDILPHGLALARRLLGVSLDSAAWRVGEGGPGEIRTMADIAGTSVMLAVSMRARPTENSLTVRCDAGTVHANLFHGYATIERGAPSRLDKVGRPFVGAAQALGAAAGNLAGRAVRGEPAYPGLRELVRRFHAACAGRGPSPISVEESLDVSRARDAISAARMHGRP